MGVQRKRIAAISRRPEGFRSSEVDELVDFDAPDRMELVAGSDYKETMFF